ARIARLDGEIHREDVRLGGLDYRRAQRHAARRGGFGLWFTSSRGQEEFQGTDVGIVPRRLAFVLEEEGFTDGQLSGGGLEENHVLLHLGAARLFGRVVHLNGEAGGRAARRQHV